MNYWRIYGFWLGQNRWGCEVKLKIFNWKCSRICSGVKRWLFCGNWNVFRYEFLKWDFLSTILNNPKKNLWFAEKYCFVFFSFLAAWQRNNWQSETRKNCKKWQYLWPLKESSGEVPQDITRTLTVSVHLFLSHYCTHFPAECEDSRCT